MAVRDEFSYQWDSHIAMFGLELPSAWLVSDYPLDLYADDVLLKGKAQDYQEIVKAVVSAGELGTQRAHFSGKRVFKTRISTWLNLPSASAYAAYATFVRDTPRSASSLVKVMQAVKVANVHGDALSSFTLLTKLAGRSQGSDDRSHAKAGIAIAGYASTFMEPGMLSEAGLLQSAIQRLSSVRNELAHLMSMESSLRRLLVAIQRVSRPVDGLRTYVAKALAFREWFESDADSDYLDGISDMVQGLSTKDTIDELRDKAFLLDMAWEPDKAAKFEAIADALESKAEEFAKVGREVYVVPGAGDSFMLLTSSGCAVIVGSEAHVLSNKDIGGCIELVQEAISSLLDIAANCSSDSARQYHRAITALWSRCSSMSPDSANYMSCAHRDFELSVKAVDVKAFGRNGVLDTVRGAVQDLQAYARFCAPALSAYLNKCPRDVSQYHWLRSARCLPLHRFSIPAIVSEAQRVYALTHEPDDESMERLRLAIRYQLGMCFRSRHGYSPKGFDDALASAYQDPNMPVSLAAVIESMGSWDSTGVANFDRDAAIPRDKSNVPATKDILTSAEAYRDAKPELRREILYFNKRPWEMEAANAIASLGGDEATKVKVHVGVKAESKEGGRAVTSERSDIRKANTLVTNNLLPYVDQIGGSLMSASPAKRERAIHDMARDSMDARRRGMVAYYLATDFEKFGHSLSHKLQKALFAEISMFFGEPWIDSIPDMLLEQTVVCIHGEHHASFANVTGGDGQGMRNAAWQLMLSACMVFVSAELQASEVPLCDKKPLDLVYFMDDHLFRLLVKVDSPVGDHPDKALLKKLNKCEQALCAAYRKVGLGTNEEKNTRSLYGAILTGMKLTVRGRVHVPGRAIQRCFVASNHRVPSLVDELASVSSACSSAVEDGCDRVNAMAVMLVCAGVKVSQASRTAARRNPRSIAIAMCMPVHCGGLGLPHEAHLVVDCGVNTFDEALYCLYTHGTTDGCLKQVAQAWYANLAGSAKTSLKRCGSNVTAVYNSKLESPSSTIRSALVAASKEFASMSKSVDSLRSDLDLLLDHLENSYASIPATVVLAVVNMHPYTVSLASLARVYSSSTASMLLGRADLMAERAKTNARTRTYLSKLSKLTSGAGMSGLSWESYLDTVGNAAARVRFSMPPRGPRSALVVPSDGDTSDITIHRVGDERPFAIIEPGQGGGTLSKGVNLWASMERSAVNAASDLRVAASSTPNGASLREVVDATYEADLLMQLTTRETVSDPYRSLNVVQFAPQTSGRGVRKDLQTHYATVESMVQVRRQLGRRGHVNHSAAMVVALCQRDVASTFVMTELSRWTEPDLVMRTQYPPRLYVKAKSNKHASSLVRAIGSMVVDAGVEGEIGLDDDADEILAAYASSARAYEQYTALRRQLPTMPSGGHDPIRASLSRAITLVEPARQPDAVLRFLAVAVLERVAGSHPDAMAIVESAGGAQVHYMENNPAASLLVPTAEEAARAYELTSAIDITQPMMVTLNRVYQKAVFAPLPEVDDASPRAFIRVAQRAPKFWHKHLFETAGNVCAMSVPYSKPELYAASAATWAARHGKKYAQWAFVASRAKEENVDVPGEVLTETLIYEVKARIMFATSYCACQGQPAGVAYKFACLWVWNVYARSVAKRVSPVARERTIKSMWEICREKGAHREAGRLLGASRAVVASLLMVRRDFDMPLPLIALDQDATDASCLLWLSKEVGTPADEEMDRKKAESGFYSPRAWVSRHALRSVFSKESLPNIDRLAIETLGPAARIRTFAVADPDKKLRIRRRTKVDYVAGQQEKTRETLLTETHQGRRHGVGIMPDPSSLARLEARRRANLAARGGEISVAPEGAVSIADEVLAAAARREAEAPPVAPAVAEAVAATEAPVVAAPAAPLQAAAPVQPSEDEVSVSRRPRPGRERINARLARKAQREAEGPPQDDWEDAF